MVIFRCGCRKFHQLALFFSLSGVMVCFLLFDWLFRVVRHYKSLASGVTCDTKAVCVTVCVLFSQSPPCQFASVVLGSSRHVNFASLFLVALHLLEQKNVIITKVIRLW
jgi:hypothetical protein